MEKLNNQPFYTWIDDVELRNQLAFKVISCRNNRKETQKEISKWVGISLTKIKEVENGNCKDFNAINNYINYLGEPLI